MHLPVWSLYMRPRNARSQMWQVSRTSKAEISVVSFQNCSLRGMDNAAILQTLWESHYIDIPGAMYAANMYQDVWGSQ